VFRWNGQRCVFAITASTTISALRACLVGGRFDDGEGIVMTDANDKATVTCRPQLSP
jgi:hypothetical protein